MMESHDRLFLSPSKLVIAIASSEWNNDENRGNSMGEHFCSMSSRHEVHRLFIDINHLPLYEWPYGAPIKRHRRIGIIASTPDICIVVWALKSRLYSILFLEHTPIGDWRPSPHHRPLTKHRAKRIRCCKYDRATLSWWVTIYMMP